VALVDIRPTVRRRLSLVASIVVFIAVVLAVIFFADWPKIIQNFFNWSVIKKMWPNVILIALRNTLLYTIGTFVIGLLLATALALLKMSKGPLRWFAIVFIELFRGMPALLTIIIMVFAVPIAFGWRFPGGTIGGALLALILVTGAYTAEVIRAGIEAVPKGQREAARSLGMSGMQTTMSVILPQAFRIVIPPLTNELVTLLKDTSLVYIAGATFATKELTLFGKDASSTYANSSPYVVVAVLYLIVTIPMTYLVGRLEKKMAVRK